MECIARIDFSGFKDYRVSDKNFNGISTKAHELFYNEISLSKDFNIEIDCVWMTDIDNTERESVTPKLKAFYKENWYNVSCLEYNQDFAALWKLESGDYKYFTVKISEIEKLIIEE